MGNVGTNHTSRLRTFKPLYGSRNHGFPAETVFLICQEVCVPIFRADAQIPRDVFGGFEKKFFKNIFSIDENFEILLFSHFH